MSDDLAVITALKLRALEAHAALWRAMNRPPGEAYAAICDGGEVHEAVHAILSVNTEEVSIPEEWKAHLERQDRRIDLLEAVVRERRNQPMSHTYDLNPSTRLIANSDLSGTWTLVSEGGRVEFPREDLIQFIERRLMEKAASKETLSDLRAEADRAAKFLDELSWALS